ncbi:helix-turn-helix domain-containing protein [Pedobacter agri]|uniref:helix-turn-helix domain-containing protein n=1 Tax=Pedobacter agri TaxID=454586 RepID=UPI0027827E68|nr:helix-turn-helix domain-containing protein [Pedobacter agri]MDQ1141823.1 transcriptional regulator with XRE-family HTH domain [Pedobacter agri]
MRKNTDIYKIIGANLRFFRKKSGLIQQELAEKCAVDRSKISDIENGKEDFMFSTLLAIADGLNLDVKMFFTKENSSEDK